jgi:ABC-2 type transport system permease protein
VSEPRTLGSAALVRLVAAREISARIRDKNFIISSVVILVLLIGTLGLQVALSSGGEQTRIGVVGDAAPLRPVLEAQGKALDVAVDVQELDDEAAARAAITDGDVDGVLIADGGSSPSCWSSRRRAGRCRPSSRARWHSCPWPSSWPRWGSPVSTSRN